MKQMCEKVNTAKEKKKYLLNHGIYNFNLSVPLEVFAIKC